MVCLTCLLQNLDQIKKVPNSVCVDHLKFFADGERAYVNIIVMKRIVIFFLNNDTDVAPF